MMFLTRVLGFVRGIGPMGYVLTAMGTLLVASIATVYLRGKTIEDLQGEVAKYQQFQKTAVEANKHNMMTVAHLIEELQRCARMRGAANDRANEAIEELSKARREAYVASTDRRVEVNEEIAKAKNECSNVSLPPRVTELLIAAADSANRGKDSP